MDLRVFVCDDVDGIHFFVTELSHTLGGLQVTGTAVSEPEARFWFITEQAEWDIAVVDLVLEEGSGFGVIETARQTHPEGSIVVFSAFATPLVREHCLSLGAEAVFAKSDATSFAAWLSERAGARRPA